MAISIDKVIDALDRRPASLPARIHHRYRGEFVWSPERGVFCNSKGIVAYAFQVLALWGEDYIASPPEQMELIV